MGYKVFTGQGKVLHGLGILFCEEINIDVLMENQNNNKTTTTNFIEN